MLQPLFAFDFDGVICDSAIETGLSGWQVAAQIWGDMPKQMPEQILTDFRQVRPVMETGFESILICRLLFEAISPDSLLNDFTGQIDNLVLRDQLDKTDLKKRFGVYRDSWIDADFAGWIKMNPLYPGVIDLLSQIPRHQLFIITTKQERFVSAILEANQITVEPTQIYGLERNLKKPQILNQLQQSHPQTAILFIEDRLPTLLDVIATASLSSVQLYFANWGYNTGDDKHHAYLHPRITHIDLPSLQNLTPC
ncbi:MAG: hypothetical protein CMH23_10660 [Methylophaga sp.]|nr:hypothetical protein [Methylophaga sp.]|tara:strand:- start:52704 stop:53462 length:759 start_codon:yes stop_codon:yes gene_type:complete